MFLLMFVCSQGVCLLLPTKGVCLLEVCPLGRGVSWRPPSVTSSGGYCSGQYAFYWNAFLVFFAYVILTTN